MAKEQWRAGIKDAESILACDPTGSFVGELNGKPVGCLALIKYGDSFAFVGCFIVSEEYRGKGYGKKIYNAAMTSVNIVEHCIVSRAGSSKNAREKRFPWTF